MLHTPLSSELHVTKNDYKVMTQQILAYQQHVRSLNFIIVITHLDIAYSTLKLASFLQNPIAEHLTITD
jgi:hypothetical protein